MAKPPRNLMDVDLEVLYLPRVKGRLIISGIEVSLSRNTDVVGKMDPYVEL